MSDDLIKQLYENCLYSVDRVPKEADGPMPKPIQPVEYHDGFYTSTAFAEQQPLALAAFVYCKGDPKQSILESVMIGRDCDSTATNVGAWIGAMHGESALPKKWVDTVCEVNKREMDLRELAEGLMTARV